MKKKSTQILRPFTNIFPKNNFSFEFISIRNTKFTQIKTTNNIYIDYSLTELFNLNEKFTAECVYIDEYSKSADNVEIYQVFETNQRFPFYIY